MSECQCFMCHYHRGEALHAESVADREVLVRAGDKLIFSDQMATPDELLAVLAGPFGRPGHQTAAGLNAEAAAAPVRRKSEQVLQHEAAHMGVKQGPPVSRTDNRLPEASEARKEIPLVTGLIDYFPDALAAVAYVSKVGNDQHNPGEPMHWARGKSNDHADCIARHLVDRGGQDAKGIRHSAYLAWRALALLQEELEAAKGFAPSRGSQ